MLHFYKRFLIFLLASVFLFEPGILGIANYETREYNCEASIKDAKVIMNKDCLEQNLFPKLDEVTVLDLVRDKIDTIDKVYTIDKQEIDFSGSLLSASSILPLSYYKEKFLKINSLSDIRNNLGDAFFEIPLETLAMEQLRNYGIVAADRDISKYGDCATQNFMVGMKAMEHIVIEPGKSRNANRTFSYLPGYCTGSSDQEYMFYQGICGVSSMAFRASMLDPDVTILKRSGHTKWFTKYYGDTIYGDDAAIYENIKQFEIRNDSDYPLYIKSKIIGDRPYLIFISPRPLSSNVQLKKEQTGPLSARIERNFMRDGRIITEFWSSEYAVKTEEGN